MNQPPPSEILQAAVAALPADIQARVIELAREIGKPLDDLILEASALILVWYGRGGRLPCLRSPFLQESEDAIDPPLPLEI